jgi:CheY-like chemotaxis protein
MNPSTQAAPKRVLVVDDSAVMRRLITQIVEDDPDLCVVAVAENGRVALEKVREHRPDCVLLDVEMPELSGLETIRRLRLRSAAKVVILSHLGLEGSRVRAEALRLGAVDVIDKPTGALSRDLRATRGDVIQQTLRRVLGLATRRGSEAPLPPEGARTTASILSVGVQGFASLEDRVEATALVALLNEHLALVDEVTRKHGGIVEAQPGTTSLAVFGAPLRRADHAARAVAAGEELALAIDARAAVGRAAASPFVQAGITIVTGLVLAGELGPPLARRYRMAGGAIDLATGLGPATEGYGAPLIVCGRTLAALPAAPPSRRLDVVQVAPESDPVALYQLFSPGSEIDAEALDAYARGMDHYEAGQFMKAMKAFEKALQRRPTDRAAARLLSRCRALLRAPSAAWSGVWSLDGGGRS